MNKESIGKTMLITTDNWFLGPNGQQYKAVFGTVKGIFDSEETLGLDTNKNSTNWYVQIGSMTLAGCQIHYAIETERDKVNFVRASGYSADAANGISFYERISIIFDADEGVNE